MLKTIYTFRALKNARRSLRLGYKLYKRKAKNLPAHQQATLQTLLTSLQTAILQKDVKQANKCVYSLQEASQALLPKNNWDRIRDFSVALLFAASVAIVVRQTWFELYTIPTGSMRPTLKEEDLVLVSKTDFGINTLTPTSHYTFDLSLLKRGSIVIFSGSGMDIEHNDTMYFGLIPGKKQYVKRLIGKPGDTLYFYGGQIYGIDREGKELTELRQGAFLNLEHIPFLRFEGKTQISNTHSKAPNSSVVFHQMNQPTAKLISHANGTISGTLSNPVKYYSDLYGMKNFAMGRLLTKHQLRSLYPLEMLESAPLYLELTHTPSLQNASLGRDEYGRLRPMLATSKSFLPLTQNHIEELMNHMTTCRFVVKNGKAARFGASFDHLNSLPQLKGVPDGMYEFQNGKAYRIIWSSFPPILSILWNGISIELDQNHPLLRREAEHVQQLYNLGIEFDTHFDPSVKYPNLLPSRYAYFRDEALYLLGTPIWKKDDPVLAKFLQKERQKSTSFVDQGPPVTKEGTLDVPFIQTFGIKVPEGMVLVLGDNHAMSADSRHFGFVPLANLRGGVSFLFWPPTSRWGRLPQPSIAHFTLPNLTVWGLFILVSSSSAFYLRRKYRKPLRF